MLATFTVSESMNEEFEIDSWCLPVELFKYMKDGLLDAFRVDFIEGRFQVTISGDNDDEQFTALMVTFSDGPESIEYHIAT